ncbi:hypothetical protein [Maricaulis sp.]|uniref:hypothetical protein n=1 Tax=Maricaulis sp. TaxID=1486257 RepID=UPI0026305CD4|nr:hypothetical protein [Maricaulis sp.]
MVSRVEMNIPEATAGLLRRAASETGVDFGYLARTAARESNFDARAEARTSSAAGMFQFIEQTWLGTLQRHGAKHGYAAAAAMIDRGADGRFTVSDPARQQEVLDLRFDPAASAVMAAELAGENAQVIESRLGRPASGGELYAAHFLGANGAAGLIAAAERSPQRRADELFPQAAAANRPIFYDGARPRGVAEVLASLTGEGAGRTPAPMMAPMMTPVPVPVTPPAMAGAGASAGRSSAPVATGMTRFSGGELSPALVEILAELDAPRRAGSEEA